MSGTSIHAADRLVPITSPAIRDGAIAVRDGLIEAIGPRAEVTHSFPNAEITHWAGVMTPGLVNAHTHLQYTSFDAVGAQAYPDYTAWSVRFLDEYADQAHADWAAIAHDGVDRLLRAGVTAIGDVVTDVAARDVLSERGIPGVAYLEIIGVDLGDWNGGLADRLREAVVGAPTTASTSVGISPHAPYSVDGPVLSAVARLADELGVRTHIHLAESDGEDEFYRTGTGSLAERVRAVATRRVGVLEQGGVGVGAAEYLHDLGVTGPTCHFAHGVYLGETGRRIVADDGSMVALCPRSNRVVGVDHPPVADFLREGVPFAVGTDSLSSVGSLELLADVALLRDLAVDGGYGHRDLDARLMHAATVGGARALGLDGQLGSLEIGKRADLAVFDVDGDDPVSALTTAGPDRCIATMIAGELRWKR